MLHKWLLPQMGRLFTNSFFYILAYRYTKALESDVFSILGRIQSTHVLCSFQHAEEVLLKEANNHPTSSSGPQNPWKCDGEDIFEQVS